MFRPTTLATTLATTLLLVTACLTAAAGSTVAAAPDVVPAARAASRSLSVSPTTHVGGQSLTWTGSVGHPGVRRLVLQRYLGRPGDHWLPVDGFASRTRADGSFTFSYPAPDMLGIFFRVKAGAYTSPRREFNAKAQDLTIALTGQRATLPALVDVAEPFGITVDTTPDGILRSSSTNGLPVFAGRRLTLQRRVGGSWSTLATTTVDAQGLGSFPGLTEPAGVPVYRVREENVTGGGNRIGWTQSFPLYVYVGPEAQAQYAQAQSVAQLAVPVTASGQRISGATTTAAQTYRWAPSIWDFDWETGQSLTSPPSRGTSNRGTWLDYSDGGGRVIRRNGAILIDSKRRDAAGPGDFGTTRVTLQGQSAKQGRWETRLHLRDASERGDGTYAVSAELVPARAADYDCGAHNITIAQISPFTRAFQIGVRSPTSTWTRTASATSNPVVGSHNFAVEVTSTHLTWFVDGRPVGSVKAADALSGVPMTLRLSLAGDGQEEMDQVSLFSDWQRGFPVDRGRQVVSKVALTRHAAAAPAC